jgi:multiple sugar transport system permease protein
MKRILKNKNRDELLFLLLSLPSLAGMAVFFVVPFGASLYLAMIDNNVNRGFVLFNNFTQVLSNGAFRLAFGNTVSFIAVCVPVNMVLTLLLALLLRQVSKHRMLFCTFFLLPLVIPSGSVVYFWKNILGVNGIVNGIFFNGVPVDWLNTDFVRLFVVVVFMWKIAGFNTILYLAGLDMIPKTYYESASIEGAGKIRQFFSITLLYITPTSFVVFLMSFINSFKSFKEIYQLTGAYPFRAIYMLQHYMNNQFSAMDYQKLSAASYILTALTVALVLFLFRAQHTLSKNLV